MTQICGDHGKETFPAILNPFPPARITHVQPTIAPENLALSRLSLSIVLFISIEVIY